MPDSLAKRAFRVSFDDAAFDEDLARASAAGREVARTARQRLTHAGAPVSMLRPCQADARDGTSLPNCLKAYLPPPAGPWGMVFEVRADPPGRLVLHCLAFGRRHPKRDATSVYQAAHQRLHTQ